MRIFLLEHTVLRHLADWDDGPAAGDVVAYWRHGQDMRGEGAAALRQGGVRVEWAEERISEADVAAIDQFFDDFTQRWHKVDGDDLSKGDGISLGEALTARVVQSDKLNQLVRFGEICRRLLQDHPQASEVVVDFIDGTTGFSNDRPSATSSPRRTLIGDLARARGVLLRDVGARALPAYCSGVEEPLRVWPVIRALIGGLRPKFLRERARLWFQPSTDRARAYVFFNWGVGLVAQALARRGDIDVFGDRADAEGVRPLRYDQNIVLPSLSLVRAALRLRRHVLRLRKTGFANGTATFESIDYGPYLLNAIARLVGKPLAFNVFKMGQVRAMLRRHRPDVVVINGEGNPAMRGVIYYAKALGIEVAFVDHGYCLVPYGYHPFGRNHPHVIFIAPGTTHSAAFGKHLSQAQKPRAPAITNPATIAMNRARGKRPQPSGRRILLTNYTAAFVYSVNRAQRYDLYFRDLCEAARTLAREGYTVSYRPHPHDDLDYVRFLLSEAGLNDVVAVDDAPTFEDALLAHDVVVGNVSSCVYQALYAGWPTIFYEPDFDPAHFVGLPADTDIDRPVAATPDALARLIREAAEDPESPTARFPELFNTVYADRYIGRNADRADQVIAEFLAENHLVRSPERRAAVAQSVTSPP